MLTIGKLGASPDQLGYYEQQVARSDWDLLVSPHHLDEPLDQFQCPRALVVGSPPSPATLDQQWMLDHYRKTADATARAHRSLVLAGDCLTARGVVAGLQRRQTISRSSGWMLTAISTRRRSRRPVTSPACRWR